MVVNSVFDEPKQEKKVWKSKSRYRGGNLHFLRLLRGLWTSQTFLRTQTLIYLKLLHPKSDSVLMWRILSEFCSIDPYRQHEFERSRKHKTPLRKTHVQFVLKINFFISISALLDILPTTSHYTKILFFILYNTTDNTGTYYQKSSTGESCQFIQTK